jgi:hypothetical protein
MTEQERELDLALADAMQENAQLRAKVADYEALIRDLTDALRGQPEQEPVAWIHVNEEEKEELWWHNSTSKGKPLYTTPPQRTWVGLTDDEVKNLCLSVGAEPIEVRLIEAKLKEKNT